MREREGERERGKTLAKEQTRLSLLSLRPFLLPSAAAASAARKGEREGKEKAFPAPPPPPPPCVPVPF